MINNEFTTTITADPGPWYLSHYHWAESENTNATRRTDGSLGPGSGGTVNFDPRGRPIAVPTVCPNTGGVRNVVMPDFLVLGHELIHAERYTRGARFPFRSEEYHTFQASIDFHVLLPFPFGLFRIPLGTRERTASIRKEELATIGLASNDDCDITENDLRKEHRLNLRGAWE